MGEARFGLLACMIDLVLLAGNKEVLIERTQELLEAAKRVGLEKNVKKIEYMVAQRAFLPEDVYCIHSSASEGI